MQEQGGLCVWLFLTTQKYLPTSLLSVSTGLKAQHTLSLFLSSLPVYLFNNKLIDT